MKLATAALLLALFSLSAGPASAADAAPTPAGVRSALEAVMPPGLRLREVKLDGLHVTVKGGSQNVQQVSQFLRAVDGTPSFRNPKLDTMDKAVVGDSSFTMTMDVQCPAPGERLAHNPCDPAAAAATGSVFKCKVNGTTTYQSTPCAAASKR